MSDTHTTVLVFAALVALALSAGHDGGSGVLWVSASSLLFVQTLAGFRPNLASAKSPAGTDAIYTQEGGALRKISLADAKLYFVPDLVEPGGTFTLPATGNTTYKGKIVRNANQATWYVDGAGNSFLIYNPEYATVGTTVDGDVSGVIEDMVVTGIRERPVLSTAPTTGQALVWNGSAWAPATVVGAFDFSTLPTYMDNAAAITGGLSVGQAYVVASGSDAHQPGTVMRVI